MRAITRWMVGRHALHEAMRDLDKELRTAHRAQLSVTVELARAERRIRELENQNLRLLRSHDFHSWESEMGPSS